MVLLTTELRTGRTADEVLTLLASANPPLPAAWAPSVRVRPMASDRTAGRVVLLAATDDERAEALVTATVTDGRVRLVADVQLRGALADAALGDVEAAAARAGDEIAALIDHGANTAGAGESVRTARRRAARAAVAGAVLAASALALRRRR